MSPRPLDPETTPFDRPLQLARDGRHVEAVAGLLEALEGRTLHPQHRAAGAGALARISRLAEAAGDLENAEHALDEALRIAPGYADLHFQLACVLLLRQERARARQTLVAALRINPGYVAARVELALLDAREGLLGEALEMLRLLGQQHRIEKPSAFREGLRSLERADWDEAEVLLKQALEVAAPGMDEVVHQFHHLMTHGDRTGAARVAREALRHHEGYADLHYLLGTAELEEGHLDDAVASFARALELQPDYHAARVQLARALEALGDVTQAGEQVELVLMRDPQHPQALQLSDRWGRLRSHRRRSAAEARKAS